jgi:hypothetical protein
VHGAGLTYARRCVLFTVLSIAGERDLDAPDLNAKVDLEMEHCNFDL